MAEDIPLEIKLEGGDGVISKLEQIAGSLTGMLTGASSEAKSATAMLEDMAAALERAAEAQKAYGEAAMNGSTADAPKTASDMNIQAPEGVKFTFGGDIWKEALETIKDSISPEDFKEIADAIIDNFTKPLSDIPEKADKAGKHAKDAGENAGKAFEKAGSAAEHFMGALQGASLGSFASGLNELAQVGATVARSLGLISEAGAALTLTAVGVGLAIAGVVGAQGYAAKSAADTVIEMDNLGKTAGVSAEEIYRLKEAFVEFGSSGEKLSMIVKNISSRMLADWPEIQKQVRDSADNMAMAVMKISDAYSAVADAQRQAAIADENVRDAQRAVTESERNIARAKEENRRASNAVQEALEGETRAQLRLADAQRNVGAAARNQQKAAYDLEEALKRQKLAAFAAADAEARLKQATLSLADTQNSYDSAKLAADKLRYQKRLENGGPRDFELERSFPRREKKIREDAIFNAEADAEAALKKSKEDKLKAEIEASFPNREKEKADLDVADARDRLDAANDNKTQADLELKDAMRGIGEAEMAVAEALRKQAAAVDAIPAAIDANTKAISALASARQDAADAPRRVEEARIQARVAEYQLKDLEAKDPKKIAESINATPDERKKRGLVDLKDVNAENFGRGLALAASPDGKAAPSPYQVIEKLNKLLSANPNDPTLDRLVSKSIASRGSSTQDVINFLKTDPKIVNDVMRGVDTSGYQGDDIALAKQTTLAWEKLKSSIEAGALKFGEESQPVTIDRMEGFKGVTDQIPQGIDAFKGLYNAISPVTDAFNPLGSAATKLTTVFSSVSTAYDGLLNKLNVIAGDGNPYRYGPRPPQANPDPGWGSAAPKPPGNGASNDNGAIADFIRDTANIGAKNNQAADTMLQASQNMQNAAQQQNAEPLAKSIGRAEGGPVSGPGTGKSDSIPAWLSDGEYVIQSDAVKHWGVDTLDSINNMEAPGFAYGGRVSDQFRSLNAAFRQSMRNANAPFRNLNSAFRRAMHNANAPFRKANADFRNQMQFPRFAEGGLVADVDRPSVSPESSTQLHQYALDIRTDEGTFQASVSGDTMKALSKSAMGAKIKSSGTKPSWYGR